jgi:hypothetical protein
MPMTKLAARAFKAQMKASRESEYLFPTTDPKSTKAYISSLKTTWTSTLKRAGVPHFPLYHLRQYADSRIMPTSNGTERLGRLGVVSLVGIIRGLFIGAPLPKQGILATPPQQLRNPKNMPGQRPEEDFGRDAAAGCKDSSALASS